MASFGQTFTTPKGECPPTCIACDRLCDGVKVCVERSVKQCPFIDGPFPDKMIPETPQTTENVYRVTLDGSGNNDGRSWNNSMTLVQACAAATDGSEIWVQENTYRVDANIVVNAGVSIYGGFLGGETLRSQRQKVDLDVIQLASLKTIFISFFPGPGYFFTSSVTPSALPLLVDGVAFKSNFTNVGVYSNNGNDSNVLFRNVYIVGLRGGNPSILTNGVVGNTFTAINMLFEDNITSAISLIDLRQGSFLYNTVIRNNSLLNNMVDGSIVRIRVLTYLVNTVFYGNYCAIFPNALAQVMVQDLGDLRLLSSTLDGTGKSGFQNYKLDRGVRTRTNGTGKVHVYNSIVQNHDLDFQGSGTLETFNTLYITGSMSSTMNTLPILPKEIVPLDPVTYAPNGVNKGNVIDKGDNAYLDPSDPSMVAPLNIVTDVHGYNRVFNFITDVGAVEQVSPFEYRNIYDYEIKIANCTETNIALDHVSMSFKNHIFSVPFGSQQESVINTATYNTFGDKLKWKLTDLTSTCCVPNISNPNNIYLDYEGGLLDESNHPLNLSDNLLKYKSAIVPPGECCIHMIFGIDTTFASDDNTKPAHSIIVEPVNLCVSGRQLAGCGCCPFKFSVVTEGDCNLRIMRKTIAPQN